MSPDDPRDQFGRYLADLLAREYRSATAEDVPAADLEAGAAALLGAADSVQIEPGPAPDPEVGARAVIVGVSRHGHHATSYKLANLRLSRAKLAALAAESVYFGKHSLDSLGRVAVGHVHPNPILFGLGLLLLIRCAVDALALELTGEHASVCWGLIRAQGKDASAGLEDIERVCNDGRSANNLDPLSRPVVLASLDALKDAGIAAPAAGARDRWTMTELSFVL